MFYNYRHAIAIFFQKRETERERENDFISIT